MTIFCPYSFPDVQSFEAFIRFLRQFITRFSPLTEIKFQVFTILNIFVKKR